MKNCIFCKIIDNEIPSYTIYEDDDFLAFLDINPKEEGHTLVIPKKHFELVWDLDEELIGKYFQVCKKIANHFQNVSGNKYVYSLVHGEGVPHAHVHIIPSESGTFGKKLTKFFDEKDRNDDDIKMDDIAKKYKLQSK